MSSVVYSIYLHSITLLTVLLQSFVFYLVLKKSPRNMKHYRFYLNYFTFWDLMLAFFMGSVLQPESLGPLLVRPNGLVSMLEPKYQVIAVSFLDFERNFN
jgi:uncharacterized membrane protein